VVEIAEDDTEPTIALRTEQWKYMLRRGKDEELYALEEDVAETRNLIAERPREAATLRAVAARFVAQRGERGAAREAASIDEAALRDLRNLGYIR
jgi:arylsulfatase A-like enzyme